MLITTGCDAVITIAIRGSFIPDSNGCGTHTNISRKRIVVIWAASQALAPHHLLYRRT